MANAAGGGQETGRASLAPGLYVTATPIGNAADITLRALTLLRYCDAIVAEDTRVTARLLAIHGISRPLLTYNDHNAPAMRPKLLERLRSGQVLALVSDAGTPLISDPGHKLVKEARREGFAVFPVPGPSSALAALSAGGLPTDRFLFAGFLPAKAGERAQALMELAAIPATLVFFEAPHRLSETLAAMAQILGSREAIVARELTKLHEEFREGSLDQLASYYEGKEVKGEVTLIVAPPDAASAPERGQSDALLARALAFMPVKEAASLIAEATGEKRQTLYTRALALKGKGGGRADDAQG